MSKEVDEEYFETFFKFVGDIMEEKYPFKKLFEKYTVEEVLEIISHSVSTTFLTLARMDNEMNFVSNLLNLINFIRTGNTEYRNLDAMVNMYNKMTNLFIREIYKNVSEVSKMGVNEDTQNMFKELLKDIKEIIGSRSDFRENSTSE